MHCLCACRVPGFRAIVPQLIASVRASRAAFQNRVLQCWEIDPTIRSVRAYSPGVAQTALSDRDEAGSVRFQDERAVVWRSLTIGRALNGSCRAIPAHSGGRCIEVSARSDWPRYPRDLDEREG